MVPAADALRCGGGGARAAARVGTGTAAAVGAPGAGALVAEADMRRGTAGLGGEPRLGLGAARGLGLGGALGLGLGGALGLAVAAGPFSSAGGAVAAMVLARGRGGGRGLSAVGSSRIVGKAGAGLASAVALLMVPARARGGAGVYWMGR